MFVRGFQPRQNLVSLIQTNERTNKKQSKNNNPIEQNPTRKGWKEIGEDGKHDIVLTSSLNVLTANSLYLKNTHKVKRELFFNQQILWYMLTWKHPIQEEQF